MSGNIAVLPALDGPLALAQYLFYCIDLSAQLAGIAVSDIGFEHQGGAWADLRNSLRCALDHIHHFIPLPLDKGEHGVSFIWQARFAHNTHGFCDCFSHSLVRIGKCGGNRECNNHGADNSAYPGTMSATNVTVPHEYVIAVDHVGVAVPDFDTAVEWYRANLGWVNHHDEVNEEQGVHEAMLGPATMLEGGAMLQILAPLNEESTIAKYIDKKGPGIQQYAVRVTDIDALMAHLKEQGTRVLYPEPKRGTANSRINFIHPKDAGGVLLELVEPAK